MQRALRRSLDGDTPPRNKCIDGVAHWVTDAASVEVASALGLTHHTKSCWIQEK
jgi:hypothetical protein